MWDLSVYNIVYSVYNLKYMRHNVPVNLHFIVHGTIQMYIVQQFKSLMNWILYIVYWQYTFHCNEFELNTRRRSYSQYTKLYIN